MDAISVSVRRGDVVESRHRVHAVLVREGVVAETGEIRPPSPTCAQRRSRFRRSGSRATLRICRLRSSAIACACTALPEHLAAVEALLGRSGASDDDLECGPVGGLRVRHTLLGQVPQQGLPWLNGLQRKGYRLAGHPLQEEIRADVADARAWPKATWRPRSTAAASSPLPCRSARWRSCSRGRLRRAPRGRAGRRGDAISPAADRRAGGPRHLAMEGGLAQSPSAEPRASSASAFPTAPAWMLKAEDGAGRAAGAALGALLEIDELNPRPCETAAETTWGRSWRRAQNPAWRFSTPQNPHPEDLSPEGSVLRLFSFPGRERRCECSRSTSPPDVEELQSSSPKTWEKGFLTYDEIVGGWKRST